MLIRFLAVALIALLAPAVDALQPGALRIVVVEGEDAVNIIQQKTAVAPVVEVRDRNNLPVPGAIVTFSIEGGKAATFGGASTLSVATNAAGQAAVTGLTPSAAGAFQIQVSAAFQGQVATATIAQTNVMTAAQAAAASAATGGSSAGSAGGGAGAAGGGAAGGGGMSATTIGIVGAAAGGGALAATQVLQQDDSQGERFTGTVTGPMVQTNTGPGGFACRLNSSINVQLTLTLSENTSASVRGTLEARGTETIVSGECRLPPITTSRIDEQFDVAGTPASFGFQETQNDSDVFPDNPGITRQGTTNVVFEASINGNTVTGTLKVEERGTTSGNPEGTFTDVKTGTFSVTLTKS